MMIRKANTLLRPVLVAVAMMAALPASSQDYEFNLFRAVCESSTPSSNVFISPFSVRSAMTMVSSGAFGTTRREILDAVGFESIDQEWANAVQRRARENYSSHSGDVEIDVAYGLWAGHDVKFRSRYRRQVGYYYNAGVGVMSVEAINAWVDEATHHLIPKIIDCLPSDAALAITSAIYFRAGWSTPFPEGETRQENFRCADGKQSLVRMMHNRARMRYASMPEFEVAELEYGDGTFCMDVILPKGDIDGCIASLDADTWDTAVKSMAETMVEISLPRFDADFRRELSQPLRSLGIAQAFTPSADFSRMTKTRVCVGEVHHRAAISVTEKGTEAAAATAVVMTKTSLRPLFDLVVPFRVDRPFLTVIRESRSGSVLFVGRITSL